MMENHNRREKSMKGYKKIVFLMLIAALTILCNMSVYAASKGTTANRKQTGWIDKGKYTYYRTEDGKLLKNTTAKIDDITWRFDEKGRLVKGVFKRGQTYYYHGRNRQEWYAVIRLRVTEKHGDWLIGKNKREKYEISNNRLKIYNKNGKRISFSKLKKGTSIKVYFTGETMEVYPGRFCEIIKIKLL